VSAVRYEFAEGAARITLSDGDGGNPLNRAMVDQLSDAVRRARGDDARVVLLRSEGRAFSVGGDVRAFAAAEDREQFVDDLAESLHRIVSDLHRMDAVVVCAVQGMAAGAGVPIAAAADVVLAAESARFTLAYTKLGYSPDGGSTLLTASIGLHRALHLALLNPVLSAAEAMAAGLVAEVHPDEELDAAVERVVTQLLVGSRDGPGGGEAAVAGGGHSDGRGGAAPGDVVGAGGRCGPRRHRGRGRLPGQASRALPEHAGTIVKAVVAQEQGGSEVLWLVELPEPSPGPGEVRVDVRAAG